MIALVDSSCFEQAPASDSPNVPSQTGSEHRYSVTALTDTTGAVVERYGYDAYGNMTVLDPTGTTVRAEAMQPYGTTGRRYDSETGLWFFRSRSYCGHLGRFLNRSPWGYIHKAMMLYDFVSNNPGTFVESFSTELDVRVTAGIGFDLSSGWSFSTQVQGAMSGVLSNYGDCPVDVTIVGTAGYTYYDNHFGRMSDWNAGGGGIVGHGNREHGTPVWTMNENTVISDANSYDYSVSYGQMGYLNSLIGARRVGFAGVSAEGFSVGYHNDAYLFPSWGDGGDEGYSASIFLSYTLDSGETISISNVMFTGVALDRNTPLQTTGPYSGNKVYQMPGGPSFMGIQLLPWGDFSMNRSLTTLSYDDGDGLEVELEMLGDGHGQHFVHKYVQNNIPTFEYDPKSFGSMGLNIRGVLDLSVDHSDR